MGKIIDRREENPLYKKIGIRGESCERLQQKHNHHYPKIVHHHTHTYYRPNLFTTTIGPHKIL